MTFAADIRSGITRAVEREQREAARSEWALLFEEEADNFESDTRCGEGASEHFESARLIA